MFKEKCQNVGVSSAMVGWQQKRTHGKGTFAVQTRSDFNEFSKERPYHEKANDCLPWGFKYAKNDSDSLQEKYVYLMDILSFVQKVQK